MMIPIRPMLLLTVLFLSSACAGADEQEGSAANDSAAAALPSVEEAAMRAAQDRAQPADTARGETRP